MSNPYILCNDMNLEVALDPKGPLEGLLTTQLRYLSLVLIAYSSIMYTDVHMPL